MSKAKKKKGWLVGLTLLSAFILFILGIGYIPRFPLGPYKLYTDMTEMQKRSPLPIEVLSTEMLHPFTYTGSHEPIDLLAISTLVFSYPPKSPGHNHKPLALVKSMSLAPRR